MNQRLLPSSSCAGSIHENPRLNCSSAEKTRQGGLETHIQRSGHCFTLSFCVPVTDTFSCRFPRMTCSQVRKRMSCNPTNKHSVVTFIFAVCFCLKRLTCECSVGFILKSVTLQAAKNDKVKGHKLQTESLPP